MDQQKIDLSDEEQFKKVFELFYAPLCVFALQYVEHEDSANDIVQECFVNLWRQRKSFSTEGEVKSYLYTSIRNEAINVLNHDKVVQEYANKVQEKTSENFFQDHVIENETYRILTEAIDRLPNRMREIMRLVLEGKSNAEIAQVLEVSVENVHSQKRLAYKKLRPYLKDYYYMVLMLFGI
jgi:RNA polymerase sigma-70 factor (family 1)